MECRVHKKSERLGQRAQVKACLIRKNRKTMCLVQKEMGCRAQEALSQYAKGDRKICSPQSDELDLEIRKGAQQ